jgi:hypothetical protein
MRERREIARRADRALGGHTRIDLVREKIAQHLDNQRPHARVPAAEADDLERQHEPHDFVFESGPDPEQCDTMRLRCNLARSASPMRVPASLPKPVFTP